MACLKDLKKWLRLHDQKYNRYDVARCLADANLVKGDLLEILALWPETDSEDKFKSKLALACMELLVPLTWPIEKNDQQMTVNHHRHVPFLQIAQISYKEAMLEHVSGTILRTCVRTALPSIALPLRERTQRDEGIIKLLLYFCRNVVMIAQSRGASNENARRISRSDTIEAFRDQEVLALLLTLASNMGEDFDTQDTIVLEVLFHLLKGVNVEQLFMEKKQLDKRSGDELKALLSKEAHMLNGYAKTAPSRHNRFGTMIWIKRDEDGRHSTVSGQDVLKDSKMALSKMDQTKKWNRPRRANDDNATSDRFDLNEPLTETARTFLRSFVEEFLDSSFNPLFNNVRRAIEREADRVLESHKGQYFYLISWFLEAERVRRRNKKEQKRKEKDSKIDETFEPDSYGLVASVLTQESFVLLNRFMQDRSDLKAWRELQAGMRCFTQTLLIVQDMAESPTEDDQEIAENIQNRIFYEETTHDRIIAILRGYKDQGFGYLNDCTELSHVFLRMLEHYSREHVDLQIRSRRRARKKAPTKQQESKDDEEQDEGSEMEDVREAERTSKERQFDFKRFSFKFTTQPCVDTFVLFLKYYNDLDKDQLKRAHRYFHRVAFKQELSVMLFRLDIISLFNKIIKGPDNLDPKDPMFKEWEELTRQVFKRLVKKVDQRPQLVIELLFSKINATTFFLEHGYEKQTISKAKAPAALEIKGIFSLEEQIGIAVTILSSKEQFEFLDWIRAALLSAADERQSWEAEATARRETHSDSLTNQDSGSSTDQPTEPAPQDAKAPSIAVTVRSEAVRIAMFKDARLRLLMTLCGLERLGIEDEAPGDTWTFPSALSSGRLRQFHNLVQQYRENPMLSFEDENVESAEQLLRRKAIEKTKRAEYDDDSDGDLGIAGSGDEEFLFPAGGPTNTVDRKQNALTLLKKRRRRRRHSNNGDDEEGGLDEEALQAIRKAREQAELERRRKIKSEEFIRDSDEGSDQERDQAFFAREEARRKGQRNKVMDAIAAGRVDKATVGQGKEVSAKTTKRKRVPQGHAKDLAEERRKRWRASSEVSGISSDDDEMDVAHDLQPAPPRKALPSSDSDSEPEHSLMTSEQEDGNDDDEDQQKETPLSSPPHLPKSSKGAEGDDGDETTPASSQQEARLKTAGLSLTANQADSEDDAPVLSSRRIPRAVFQDSDDDD